MMSLTNLGLTLYSLVRTIFSLFCFYKSVGSVSVLESDGFAPTGVESKGDMFASEFLVPRGFESKGGQLLEKNWRLNSFFFFQV